MIPWNAILLAGIAAVSFGSGALVTHWKHGNDAFHELEQQNAMNALAQKVEASVARSTAEAIGSIQIENRTTYQETRHEVERVPVYNQCLIPANGSRLLNEARQPAGDSGKPADPLPADAANTDER